MGLLDFVKESWNFQEASILEPLIGMKSIPNVSSIVNGKESILRLVDQKSLLVQQKEDCLWWDRVGWSTIEQRLKNVMEQVLVEHVQFQNFPMRQLKSFGSHFMDNVFVSEGRSIVGEDGGKRLLGPIKNSVRFLSFEGDHQKDFVWFEHDQKVGQKWVYEDGCQISHYYPDTADKNHYQMWIEHSPNDKTERKCVHLQKNCWNHTKS